MNQLFSLNIEYSLLDQILASTAMKIAQTYNITYYDAVRLAVAQYHTSILVTEDRELLKKFNNTHQY
jgi:predicted nucleic acid-binding protein